MFKISTEHLKRSTLELYLIFFFLLPIINIENHKTPFYFCYVLFFWRALYYSLFWKKFVSRSHNNSRCKWSQRVLSIHMYVEHKFIYIIWNQTFWHHLFELLSFLFPHPYVPQFVKVLVTISQWQVCNSNTNSKKTIFINFILFE